MNNINLLWLYDYLKVTFLFDVTQVGPQDILIIGGDEDDPSIHSSVEEASWETIDSDLAKEASSKTVNFDLVEWIDSKIDIKHTKEDMVHSLPSSSSHVSCQFKHFDVLKNIADHYYQNETCQVYLWKGILFLSLFVILFGKSNFIFLVQFELSY